MYYAYMIYIQELFDNNQYVIKSSVFDRDTDSDVPYVPGSCINNDVIH